jgi:tripartite-type tricarboxylate transporter receptor subunit TctC
MAGLDLVTVQYRGDGPALTDLIGGQVQVMLVGSASIEHIRAGKLRALAVTTKTRWDALPDVPTVDDFVPSYEASGFQGLAAPKNTPTRIVDRLNKEINAALANSRIRMRYAELGVAPLGGSPADFAQIIADETEKAAKVIRTANIKPE